MLSFFCSFALYLVMMSVINTARLILPKFFFLMSVFVNVGQNDVHMCIGKSYIKYRNTYGFCALGLRPLSYALVHCGP